MYQDPTIGQLYFAALMRREYGAMKADLISRGMSAMEADRTASLYVSNRAPEWSKRFSTPTQDWVAAQGGSVLRTSLEMDPAAVSQRISTERKEWLSQPITTERVQDLLAANAREIDQLDRPGVAPAGDGVVTPPEVTVEADVYVPRAADLQVPEMDMQTAARLNEQQLQSIAPSIEGPRSAQQVAVPKDQALQPAPKTAEPAKSDSANWGTALAVMGAAQQIVGQFYALKSQQTQLKQQALSLEFQERMSQINARSAERQAADMIAAGRQQAMELTMRAGQVREGAKATMGARGIRADVGSGAETIASIELMKEVDRFTIDANAVRAANAARMQGVNAANEGLLAGTSAYSLRMQAGALNPVAGAMPSLLTAGGQYYSQRAADRRWAAWAASQGLGE